VEPEALLDIEVGRCSLLDIFMTVARRYGGGCNAILPEDVGCEAGYIWEDIGTPSGYLDAHAILCEEAGVSHVVGYGTVMPDDLSVEDWLCVGNNVLIGNDVRLCRSVIWDGVEVASGSNIADSILTPFGILHR
jgi:NDP-sugar pyrophosphorylase family protein